MAAGEGEKKRSGAEGIWKAGILIVLSQLSLAVFLVMVQSMLTSEGVNSTVFVVYEQAVASLLLTSLAYFLDKLKKPSFSIRFVCWAFLLGFLDITLGHLLLTASLRCITASFQSSLSNTLPAVIFLLAVAKLWGTLLSVSGATVVVLTKGTTAAAEGAPPRLVAKEYSADMTLSAMMTVFGTLQITAYAAVTERSPSAWRLNWRGSHQLLGVLYGGIFVTGIFYYVYTWCIRKAGPVFVGSFSPLLVVFSLVLEMVFFGATVRRWSLVGTAIVVAGMYLLLWAKAKDNSALTADGSSAMEALLLEEAQQSPCSAAS
ncbi:unnamed protein product [Spirodela intermedia]|uniref:WAT1-related protein n=1 Tax=Spirodela intermedia TaxID=51605 RepID=A0A7I8IWH0_SPIIN|nr:unnamed protein product [Spirodela intermedia]CAA6662336.1 unnamed protein product [Spirodela intermedia]